MLTAIYILLLVACTSVTITGLVSLYRTTSQRNRLMPTDSKVAIPISVLKPLCGVDDQLESSLESFFEQSYPFYELIFGVQGNRDPAIKIVRRLIARYPKVKARLVIHNGNRSRALNPKVNNLQAMLERGSEDIIVISDSNVKVAPDYLKCMLAKLTSASDIGLVTSLIAGIGEKTLGSKLENLHLATCGAGIALSQELSGNAACVGKSLMFRRSVFESLGGFEIIGCFLAEDHVMGRMFKKAGYRVCLCGGAVGNVSASASISQFIARRLRWGMIRSRIIPLGYALEPLASPIVWILLAEIFDVCWPLPLLWAIILTMVRDGFAWYRVRGVAGLLQALPFGLLADILTTIAWALAPFISYVNWRGHRYRISTGTRLYNDQLTLGARKDFFKLLVTLKNFFKRLRRVMS